MTATVYRLADYRQPRNRGRSVWVGIVAAAFGLWALVFISAARVLL